MVKSISSVIDRRMNRNDFDHEGFKTSLVISMATAVALLSGPTYAYVIQSWRPQSSLHDSLSYPWSMGRRKRIFNHLIAFEKEVASSIAATSSGMDPRHSSVMEWDKDQHTLPVQPMLNFTRNTSIAVSEFLLGIDDEDEFPRPTQNGGYTHTRESKAKISAANKGKTPWNKGKQRSEEVKARIAAGVRQRNRERFLAKLEEMGLTEEQYNQQRKAERAALEKERNSRRTEKGGYRPTEETRQKISNILRTKYAKGEMPKSRRRADPSKVRRGFSHSEETRAKISESLRRRWAEDPQYRANMMQKSNEMNANMTIREKISMTLKEKWRNPEFREAMMTKLSSTRRSLGGEGLDESHREKISNAMKEKWQDAEYRKKTLEAIAKRRLALSKSRSADKGHKVIMVQQGKVPDVGGDAVERPTSSVQQIYKEDRPLRHENEGSATLLQPLKPSKNTKAAMDTAALTRKRTIKRSLDSPKAVSKKADTSKRKSRESKSTKADLTINKGFDGSNNELEADVNLNGKIGGQSAGSVTRLREERRDLYDLLYGDDDGTVSTSTFALGDEDLDEFDPYGLENF